MEGAPKFSNNSFEGNRLQKPEVLTIDELDRLHKNLEAKVANLNDKNSDTGRRAHADTAGIPDMVPEEDQDFAEQTRVGVDGEITLSTWQQGELTETVLEVKKRHHDNRLY